MFHYLYDSLELNFCIFTSLWEGAGALVEIFRIQMKIKGKMNMLNVKPTIHDCQNYR